MALSVEDKNWLRKMVRRVVEEEIAKVAAVEPEHCEQIGFSQDIEWTDADEEPDEEPAEHNYVFPAECRIGFGYPV